MTIQNLPGGMAVPLGPNMNITGQALAVSGTTIDAANEACIMVGHIITSDGASHTIDTSGSSSLQWRTGSVTFANAGTTVKVGIADVLLTAGPPARADNTADVINFGVSASLVGGGGGITANAWQTSVPDAGSKTIANGDLVAFCVQATARAGADTISVSCGGTQPTYQYPTVTQFVGGSYIAASSIADAIIVFSDGALGYFYGSDVFSTYNTRTWNSGSATKEYGQLYQFPFPVRIEGIYGWVDPDANFDIVLYSDPLGTPVAERTVAVDANAVATNNSRRFYIPFASAYDLPANAPVGAVFKPGGSNISATYKTIADAAHRIADTWGTSGYGISRASGAFANANSSLDHYYIGLLASGFDGGGAGGGLVAPLFGGGVI